MIEVTLEGSPEVLAAHEEHLHRLLDEIPTVTWIEPSETTESKGETKMAWATLKVLKTDNGYNGVIQNTSDRGLFTAGEVIFNRQFHPFSKGTLMNVRVKFSAKGRRMVQSVTADTLVPVMESEKKPRRTTSSIVLPETVVTTTPVKEKEPVARKAAAKSPIEGYYVSPEARLAFNTALGMSNSKPERAIKLMMVGGSGFGKTTMPKLFAELAGKKFLRMNCATIRDPEEWFGYREARDGDTVFIRSQFSKMIEEGNLVVVLDEFNRLEPWLHNTLFPLLDDDGCTVVHDEVFRIGEGVIVVGTINTGYKYTGTFELDEALLNRFDFTVEVGAMPHYEECKVLKTRTGIDHDTAGTIVKMANALRQNEVVCSTRTTLLVAAMHAAGLTLREAFETAVVRRIPEDSNGTNQRKKVVDMVNVALGVLEKRDLENDIFSALDPEKKKSESKKDAVIDLGSGEFRIVMRRDPDKEWLPIHAATWLRKLPVQGGGILGFSLVQHIVRSLGEMREETVLLEESAINGRTMEEIAAGLRSCGITGTITRK